MAQTMSSEVYYFMLEHARRKQSGKRKSTERGATNRSKRKHNLVCIFCNGTTTESLHVFITLNMDKVIRGVANEMGDTN